MDGLIGRKVGMTSIFGENGKNTACTVLEMGPCVVTQVKTVESDGYNAVQLAWLDKKEKHSSKAEMGHFQKANTSPKRVVKELRNPEGTYTVGQVVDVSIFSEGDFVDAIATSKGKGFQGVVKRHGFAGVGESTHGQHNRQRHPGSIGACSFPARVFKGIRMAGRTGGDTVKINNLQVMKVIPGKNLIVVKGCVPGFNGSSLLIEK